MGKCYQPLEQANRGLGDKQANGYADFEMSGPRWKTVINEDTEDVTVSVIDNRFPDLTRCSDDLQGELILICKFIKKKTKKISTADACL